MKWDMVSNQGHIMPRQFGKDTRRWKVEDLLDGIHQTKDKIKKIFMFEVVVHRDTFTFEISD